MILFCAGPADTHAGGLVASALQRSVGEGQICGGETAARPDIAVAVGADESMADALVDWCACNSRKLVLFGRLSGALARAAGSVLAADRVTPAAAASAPAAPHLPAESDANVIYTKQSESLGGRTWRRPFARHDFADEWNNHGYGALRADDSPWAVASSVRLPFENELARIETASGEVIGSFAGLFTIESSFVLWFNRPVGPIDSFEWWLIEYFLCSFRWQTHPCQPVIGEIPFGYDAAVTVRLDCDEDIASARPLWQHYRELGIPLSLAVRTSLLSNTRNASFVCEVAASGDSVLSHSQSHPADWGGDYGRALEEASASANAIAATIGRRPANAVSPFHKTPDYALRALADCGYSGCVGGTIGEYPETVLARGGAVAGYPREFVFHTQQCMLHGDCLRDAGSQITDYCTAFDLAYQSRSLFAYLDHPFSSRYQYGWRSEDDRARVHDAFLSYIRSRAACPLFLGEDEALEFLRRKAGVRMTGETGEFRIYAPPSETRYHLCIIHENRTHRLSAAGLRLARRQ